MRSMGDDSLSGGVKSIANACTCVYVYVHILVSEGGVLRHVSSCVIEVCVLLGRQSRLTACVWRARMSKGDCECGPALAHAAPSGHISWHFSALGCMLGVCCKGCSCSNCWGSCVCVMYASYVCMYQTTLGVVDVFACCVLRNVSRRLRARAAKSPRGDCVEGAMMVFAGDPCCHCAPQPSTDARLCICVGILINKAQHSRGHDVMRIEACLTVRLFSTCRPVVKCHGSNCFGKLWGQC